MNLHEIKDTIVKSMKENGVSLLYYSSYSTHSLYLKLDNGLLNTVRISDHPGKKHLNYRYEIGPHIKEFKVDHSKKYKSYMFPSDEVDKLISTILEDRKDKMEKYSPSGYTYFYEKNAREHANDKGFWSSARSI